MSASKLVEKALACDSESLHNLNYHELKNAEGESWRLIDRSKSAFREVWMKL